MNGLKDSLMLRWDHHLFGHGTMHPAGEVTRILPKLETVM